MKTFWIIVLWTLFMVIAFDLAVLIASAVNKVGFYDQLSIWFGHGSGFEKLFIK